MEPALVVLGQTKVKLMIAFVQPQVLTITVGLQLILFLKDVLKAQRDALVTLTMFLKGPQPMELVFVIMPMLEEEVLLQLVTGQGPLQINTLFFLQDAQSANQMDNVLAQVHMPIRLWVQDFVSVLQLAPLVQHVGQTAVHKHYLLVVQLTICLLQT